MRDVAPFAERAYISPMSSHPRRSAPPTGFVTEEEFLALPETLNRTELLDGLIVREPSPGFGHQESVSRLVADLVYWAKDRAPRPDVLSGPLDVRFAPDRILQPDVVVFLEPLPRPVAMPIDRVPDLCVEIVSRRHAYDRVTKRLVYANAGVRELWTVLPKMHLVERWTGPGLADREEMRQLLTTPLLPGFELDVEAVGGG